MSYNVELAVRHVSVVKSGTIDVCAAVFSPCLLVPPFI